MISSKSPAGCEKPGPRLRDITSGQWKSGTAAWLGWLFDGLDMHLYTLVAAPFVAQLLQLSNPADPLVKRYSSWIQAAFLLGWALGGGFFGRIGDRFGRSWTLSLTILTYALFTGLSCLAQTWWHLLIFRFLAALGIGGEWAVGASLLSETWPKTWRPWIAAVLQTGVNLGILIACLAVFLLADTNPRYVFLIGILPALMVFWIRRSVPEPVEWQQARTRNPQSPPGWIELFRGPVRSLTLRAIFLCALSLTAWWAFLFWNQQHLRNLPALATWLPAERERLVSAVFFLVIASSMAGNFFAGWLAFRLGYRRAISLLFACFFLSMAGAYWTPRDHAQLLWWLPWVGFFSGVFGLFTMYLPPLFPTLLRTTGAGLSFNIGRVAAAFGTVFFGIFAQLGDFRPALFLASFLLAAAAIAALMMPELPQTRDPDLS